MHVAGGPTRCRRLWLLNFGIRRGQLVRMLRLYSLYAFDVFQRVHPGSGNCTGHGTDRIQAAFNLKTRIPKPLKHFSL